MGVRAGGGGGEGCVWGVCFVVAGGVVVFVVLW